MRSRKQRAIITLFMAMVILLSVAVPSYAGVGTNQDVMIKEKSLKKMMEIGNNQSVRLYFHPETTEIVVENKTSGFRWYSNPEYTGKKPSGKAADYMKSQVIVNYLTDKGQIIPIDNYKYSIALKQFSYEEIDSGVRVHYAIGDNNKTIDSFPKKMSGERMRRLILDKVDEKDQKYINRLYRYDEDKDRYYARKTGEQVNTMSRIEIKKLSEIMYERAGYTVEELSKDNIENGEEAIPSRPQFTITLEYVLDNEGLVVRILNKETTYDEKYPIESIHLLSYFGATTLSDEGYMVVPDGSGALIYLNNGKYTQRSYSQKLFGEDEALFEQEKAPITEKASLPIFGTSTTEGGFLGVIEKGAEMATINADVSGRLDLCNKISSQFNYKNTGIMELVGKESKQELFVWSKQTYEQDIQVRFFFLDRKHANYNEMAKIYQKYLVNTYALTPQTQQTQPPFFIDLLGSYTKKSFFLGIPYQSVKSLTTFKEAKSLLEQLKEKGVEDIVLRYTGWFNKGINHSIPKKVKVDGVLGGKKGLKDLLTYGANHDVNIFPDVAFKRVYDDNWSFSPRKDAARFLDGRIAMGYPYNLASQYQDPTAEPFWYIAPTVISKVVKGFTKSFSKLTVENLALRDLGNELHTDFKNKDGLRDASVAVDESAIDVLSDRYNLLMDNPNSYALPYAKYALNIPFKSSSFNIVDEDIPFYQLVVNGYLPYSAPSANLHTSIPSQVYFMRCLESGSGLHFTWAYENTHQLKLTTFNAYNSTYYERSFDQAIELYEEYEMVMNQIKDTGLKEHVLLDNGLRMTVYGDDTKIVFNYTHKTQTYKGNSIKPNTYKILREEG